MSSGRYANDNLTESRERAIDVRLRGQVIKMLKSLNTRAVSGKKRLTASANSAYTPYIIATHQDQRYTSLAKFP